MNDLISRQAAIDALNKKRIETMGKGKDVNLIWECLDVVAQVPSAQRKGKWKMETDPYGFFEEIPVCSECGCTTEIRKTYNFCPNCVAYMMKGAEE